MTITAEDEYQIVSITNKDKGLNIDELVTMFRTIALALTYHPDSVRNAMPDEHDIAEIVREAISFSKEK
jgi:hypothetical protein